MSKKRTPAYKSNLEIAIAEDLISKDIPILYETQKLCYTVHKTYKPDFLLPNGIIIEAKGWHRGLAQSLREKRLVKEQHPELDIRFVWSKLDMKLTKTMTAEQWSIKYGFKYAEKLVPQSWLEE